MRRDDPNRSTLVYIGLGSNLGDRKATLESAVQRIAALPETSLLRVSSWYENPAVGIPNGNVFLNGVAEIETRLGPYDLLEVLLEIERDHGRQRSPRSDSGAYLNRTLDLDILIYGNLVLESVDLKIPHPKMWEREFVRVPLAELGISQK